MLNPIHYLVGNEHPLFAGIDKWWEEGLRANRIAEQAVVALVMMSKGTTTGEFAHFQSAAFGGISYIEFSTPPVRGWQRHKHENFPTYYKPSSSNRPAQKILQTLPRVSWTPLLMILSLKRRPYYAGGQTVLFDHPDIVKVEEGFIVSVPREIQWYPPAGVDSVTDAYAQEMIAAYTEKVKAEMEAAEVSAEEGGSDEV